MPSEITRKAQAAQRPRRSHEEQTRRDAIAFMRWCARSGRTRQEGAALLGISHHTLRDWSGRWRKQRMSGRLRGRPLLRPDRHQRNNILGRYHLLGPGTGVATLRQAYPLVPRRELRNLIHRYRRIYRRRNGLAPMRLRWRTPGAVWAMDYTQPLLPIEGLYPQVLVVRDLGSGCQLMAMPVLAKSALLTSDLVRVLIAAHGAPLVFKHDNDTVFLAPSVQDLLAERQILTLLSPTYTPQYNGAAEAGIGSLQVHALYQSLRRGHPGEVTMDDLEAARRKANELSRPFGFAGPTPDEAWKPRRPITPEVRQALRDAYRKREAEARKELNLPADSPLEHGAQAAVDRKAIERALIDCGHLSVRRRRIPLPVKCLRAMRIS